ncbi:MAG: TetR/AcrR family transcriptional regulator [bacterium]
MVTPRLPTEQRRRQIADAALRLLADAGVAGLTLVELGRAVGISDASVLRHFKDKPAIVEAAIERFGELLAEDLPTDIADPLRRLGAFFVRRLTKVRAHPELMALAYDRRLRDAAGEAGTARVDAHIGRSARFVGSCIDEAREAGAIGADIPTQMWVWIIAGLLRGASFAVPPRPGPGRRLDADEPTLLGAGQAHPAGA